jgi:hypothetical protein
VHELSEDDPDRRSEFCDSMMNLCTMDSAFVRRIVFLDEATFCLNGWLIEKTKKYCRYIVLLLLGKAKSPLDAEYTTSCEIERLGSYC